MNSSQRISKYLRGEVDLSELTIAEREQLSEIAQTIRGFSEPTPPEVMLDQKILRNEKKRKLINHFGKIGWLAATAACILWFLPDPKISDLHGIIRITGDQEFEWSGLRAEIHGDALIVAEPVPSVVRENALEVSMNPLTARITGATLGGVLTIAVLSGSAAITDEQGERQEIRAGEVLSRTTKGTTHRSDNSPLATLSEKEKAALSPEQQKIFAALQQELREEKTALDLKKGQLKLFTGTPQAWTEDIPSRLREEAMKKELQEIFPADQYTLTLACEEFPCIATAVFKPEVSYEDAAAKIKEYRERLRKDAQFQNDAGQGNVSAWRDGSDQQVSFALVPQMVDSEELGTRIDYRMQKLKESP